MIDIPLYRLHNQRLSRTNLTTPVDVVNWFGAVQSQDFAGAKWAIGLRTTGLTDTDVERAFTDGSILRTHLLRPTWHFVTPTDIRWMLRLTAPRVRALLAYNDRQMELDRVTINKSNEIFSKTLRDGKNLTRNELGAALQKKGINTDDLRLTNLAMHAELDSIICSGPRQGKQFTYALLEERVPPSRVLEHDEAVAELARRYFQSHGPATAKDFGWWSGLTAADVKLGLEAIKSDFAHESVNGNTYWFVEPNQKVKSRGSKAYFLPNYDEYTVGYTDRSAIFDSSHSSKLDSRGSVLSQHVVLAAGQIVASWKRTQKTKSLSMEARLFETLTKAETHAMVEAAERYAGFLGLPFELTLQESEANNNE